MKLRKELQVCSMMSEGCWGGTEVGVKAKGTVGVQYNTRPKAMPSPKIFHRLLHHGNISCDALDFSGSKMHHTCTKASPVKRKMNRMFNTLWLQLTSIKF